MTAERPAESLALGARIGHYEVLDLVGRGGMGTVYRVRDLNLGREVALKRPRSPLLDDPRARRRFTLEARAASRLQHPNILTIFEVFEHDGFDWIAMEYVDGRTLASYLEDRGPLEPREVLRHAEGLADALREAQGHRIIHRDIKPSNILVDHKGLARLTDFGLARFQRTGDSASFDTTATAPITELGGVIGTAAYMSPEQALGQEIDGRSDIFSLGAVLYEMCTARTAFGAESRQRVLDAVLHREPRPIQAFNPGVSDEIVRIVGKCLAKRADERYQSADELLTDLRAERRRLQSSEYATSHPLPAKAAPRRTGLLLAAAAVATVSLAAIAGFVWLASRADAIPDSVPRQITALPAWEAEVAISPDGRQLAYASNESGNADIWVMDVGGGEALRLTFDPAPDRSPAWFPDGSAIAFRSARASGAGIWKVSRLGGTPTLVVADARDPALSPDGTLLAISKEDESGERGIAVVDLRDPAKVTPLTDSDDGLWGHRTPAWSPDGKWICYNDFRDLWLVPAAGGEARRLTADAAGDREPAWSPSGRHVYFASRREGTLALWRVRASGGTPQRITVGTGPEGHPSLSEDGSRLAYTTFAQNFDPVVVDLESGRRTRFPGAPTDWGARVTPDNRGFVFVSDRAGPDSLWWQALAEDGPSRGPIRLNDQAGESSNPEVSADGRWVAYQQRLGPDAHIAVLPLPTGPPTAVTARAGFHVHPAWSPDGSEIAYVTDRDVAWDLMVVPVEGGRPAGTARVVVTGESSIMWPKWSPDGTSIAFTAVTDDSREIWITGAGGGSEPRRLTRGAEVLEINWVPGADGLFASGYWGGQEISIRRVDPTTGDTEALDWPVDFGHAAVYGIFDVSDDQSLVLYTAEEMAGDLWILEASRGAF